MKSFCLITAILMVTPALAQQDVTTSPDWRKLELKVDPNPGRWISTPCPLDDEVFVDRTPFSTPTKDETPVHLVLAGRNYRISRNYFFSKGSNCKPKRYSSQFEMTLPGLQPATPETWEELYGSKGSSDKKVKLEYLTSQEPNLTTYLSEYASTAILGQPMEQVDGLSSFLRGPRMLNGGYVSDIYYAPTKQAPETVIQCGYTKDPRSGPCTALFEHNGIEWRIWIERTHLHNWRGIISSMRAKIDSFLEK